MLYASSLFECTITVNNADVYIYSLKNNASLSQLLHYNVNWNFLLLVFFFCFSFISGGNANGLFEIECSEFSERNIELHIIFSWILVFVVMWLTFICLKSMFSKNFMNADDFAWLPRSFRKKNRWRKLSYLTSDWCNDYSVIHSKL